MFQARVMLTRETCFPFYQQRRHLCLVLLRSTVAVLRMIGQTRYPLAALKLACTAQGPRTWEMV